MRKREPLPPALIEALLALAGEDAPEDAAFVVIRPSPREALARAFQEGLELGHQFRDIFGGKLSSVDDIIEALKADGRVHVSQVVELDPELVPYL